MEARGSQMERLIQAAGGAKAENQRPSIYPTSGQMERLIAAMGGALAENQRPGRYPTSGQMERLIQAAGGAPAEDQLPGRYATSGQMERLIAAVGGEPAEDQVPGKYVTAGQMERLIEAISGGGSIGELVTVTGLTPLVLANALAGAIQSLTQTGKCVQSGTPTPEAPVDIVCNNGAVKVGRESYTTPLGRTVYGGTLDVTSGVLTVDMAMVTFDGSADETWTYSSSYAKTNTAVFYTSGLTDAYYPDWSNYRGYIINLFPNATRDYLYKNDVECMGFTGMAAASAFPTVRIFKTRASNETEFRSFLNNNPIQFVYELATPQTYQLTPQTVEMIAERSMFQSNANGNIDIAYYANGILKTVNGNPVVITDADGQNAEDVTVHIEPIQSGSGTPSPTNIRPISGMTDINITRLGGVVADGTPEVLTVGTQTATVANLYAVGDYADEVDVVAGTVTRRVGMLVLDGTEEWRYRSDYNLFSLAGIGMKASGTPRSTHFPYKTFTTGEAYGVGYIYSDNLFIKNTDCADLAAFKSYLAAQYAAGTPVIVIYPLAEETTESVTPQPLRTEAGDTTISATSEVGEVELEVTYRRASA